MEILLDTNAFIWWSEGNPRTRAEWLEPMANPANTVYLSAVTAWEMAIKQRSGKLVFRGSIEGAATFHGFSWISITPADAESAGSLEWDHKDPFDRMLVAQAISRGLTVVSSHDVVRAAPGIRAL
jgi:PIN domain nuclease of toxin-antitoxin system